MLPVISGFVQWRFITTFHDFPFVIFYPTVIVAALVGGLWGGLLATAVAALLADYLFLDPHMGFSITSPASVVALVLFALVGVAIAAGAERMHLAQAALAEELAKTSSLLDRASAVAHVGAWEIDTLTMDGSWTDEAARIHDLDPAQGSSVAEAIGFFTEESRPIVEAAMGRAVSDALPYDLELEIISAKGVRKWVRTVGVPDVTDGHVTHLRGIIQDITERKTAELERQRVSDRFRMLFERAPDGIFLADPEGNYIDVSPSGTEMFGYTREEILRLHISDLVAPDEADHVPGEIETVSTQSESHREWRFRRKDGTTFWGDVLAVSLPNGNIQAFVRDVTESREVRENLARTRQRLELALSAGEIGVWDFDFATGAFGWDARMWALNGVSPSDYGSPQEAQRAVMAPEDLQRMFRVFEEALAARRDFVDDAKLTWPDGSVHFVRSHSHFTFADDGTPVSSVGVTYDVTDQVEMNRVLEQRVALRTAEVTAANKELEAFSYAVSHDLRAPLRAMSGFSAALTEDYGDRLDDTAKDYLDHIVKAARSMGELIDGLLVLSRNTRGDIDRRPIDITAMCERLIAAQREAHPERTFTASVEPGLCVTGDPRMIEVVMQNLVNNAGKYSSHTADARITVESEEYDDRLWVCVADNGAGFDPRYIESLFEPFRRLHRQDEFPGIGIGLATVQRIVNRHGGEIRAQGEPDNGARFCIWLPGETC